MTSWVSGLIVTGNLTCDGCGKIMRHPDRYGYICEEGKPTLHLCDDCSREKGYMKQKRDEKGHEIETFLEWESDGGSS